jgi:dTMP kinase
MHQYRVRLDNNDFIMYHKESFSPEQIHAMVTQTQSEMKWNGIKETYQIELNYFMDQFGFEMGPAVEHLEIISVEGLDKSGKKTQTQMLVEHLRSLGYKVAQSETPNYNTPTGALIKDWLAKKYLVNQRTIEFVYTANRQELQEWFDQLEMEGYDFVVMDRYLGSQRAYALATGSTMEWVAQMQKYMRQPDIEIYIDITPEESMKRKGKHNDGNNDRYEEDKKLLYSVRHIYRSRMNVQINGMQPIEKVSQEIIEKVVPLIQLGEERNTWEPLFAHNNFDIIKGYTIRNTITGEKKYITPVLFDQLVAANKLLDRYYLNITCQPGMKFTDII